VLRAYSRYLRQAVSPYSQEYIEATLLAPHRPRAAGPAVRGAVRPRSGADDRRAEELTEAHLVAEVTASMIDEVTSLDDGPHPAQAT
jgi:glutamate dehydrogenase